MTRRAVLFVSVLLAAHSSAPLAAKSPPRGAADKKPAGPPAAGTAVLRLIQPQLDDIRACYARERAKNPKLSAGEIIVHAIVEGSGEVIEAVPFGVKTTAADSSGVMLGAVAPCVVKRIKALRLPAFSDGLARKVVIGFRFGADAPQAGAAGAVAGGVSPNEIRFARSVVAGESIGFSRSLGQLTHRYCWKVDSDREGCALRVLSLFPAVRVKKELAIYNPGEALNEGDRSAKENRLMRNLSGDDNFRWPPGTEMTSISWPDDRPQLELGSIKIIKPVADSEAVQRKLIFDPVRLADGIELSNDPLPPARSAVYSISYSRRNP